VFTRRFGRSGLQVSPVGLGCWAIGGPAKWGERSIGYGEVDDDESVRAIRRAVELGITFFDTAALYGIGHSERVLGRALAGRRHEVVIATKFGAHFDEASQQIFDDRPQPEDVQPACEASLRRIGTDYLDIFQLHTGATDLETACRIRDELEKLVASGKARHYGWSTDAPDRARVFAEGPHCGFLQFGLNVLLGDPAMVAVCDELDLGAIANTTFLKGLLTGKYDRSSQHSADDIRSRIWNLADGREARQLEQLARIRPILTRDGRTLAQAAIGWVLARSERAVPIPGFKTVRQVEEIAAAAEIGPLTCEQMAEIDRLLERSAESSSASASSAR
jgi:aryl-alcohol dehydrogenase-like predicted oxidoreductase